jgi:hypothetical protein
MSIHALRDALRRRPFDPFKIRLSSGDSYDVNHPENALLLRGGVYVAMGSSSTSNETGNGESDLPARAVYCALLHIAAVETAAPS